MTDNIDTKSAAEVGRLRGVEAIVTGSISKFGSTISVTVKLVDTQSAKIIDTGLIKVKNLDELASRFDELAWELATE